MHKKILIAVPIMVLMLGLGAFSQQQQQARPPLSPPGHTEVTLNGKKITIDYSRPSMRGRKIMGGLVPYGQVWRTGANAATTLTTEADLDIGGTNVPAGKYTLYSLPTEDSWKLIISKQTGQWGTEYHEDQDLARVAMERSQLPQSQEQFTISLASTGDKSASLVMEWENTRLRVPVTVK